MLKRVTEQLDAATQLRGLFLWVQNYFSELFTFLKPFMRGAGFAQRKARIEDRLKAAGKNMFEHIVQLAKIAHVRAEKR